jgi:hypothetical protein
MSLAFYASPIDFKNNDLDAKLTSEKNKLNKNMLSEVKPISKTEESKISISDIHKNLKSENDTELTNFYKSEESNTVAPAVKANYLLINGETPIKPTNNEILTKLNNILEMFEDQKEIRTGQKNEEIVLYCFLGVFVIYIMDSFVNIGKYSR